ncbi:MAG: zinc ribbon domain-containing protein [Thermoplasmata archaeon]|nr:zinc ribbon domain-containing protein [Thermoplasmata archaeon]
MALTESDKNLIIIILLITMVIVLAVEIMFIQSKKKKKLARLKETKSEEAFNKIHTTARIISLMRNQGVDVSEAERIIDTARRLQSQRNYDMAIDKAEAAKTALMRAKSDQDALRPSYLDSSSSSATPAYKPTARLIKPDYDEKDYDDEEAIYSRPVTPDSRPENYLQAKFLLQTVEDLLSKKENKGIKGARKIFETASEEYESQNYTKALSLALKVDRMLKSSSVALINIGEEPVIEDEDGEGEEVHHHPDDVVIHEIACDSCGNDVELDDAFCRKCGEELDFMVVCPGCESEVEDDDQFCRKCGEKLE